MEKIILITTSSSAYAAGNEELGWLLKNSGFNPIFCEEIKPPFDFVPEKVFGVVAGVQNKFGKKEMDYFPNLKMVTPFGVGVDHIDLVEAGNRGILVTNAPVVSGSSVAELAMAFILALARKIVSFDRSMKNKEWGRCYGTNLSGKKLGIVGLGSIGREVAKLALAFGMKISAFDIFYDEKFLSSYPVQKVDYEILLKESDFITLHIPSTVETKSLLDKKALALLKQGVNIVNTARGDIVDAKALLAALDSGKVAGYAADVFFKEPPFGDADLEKLIKHSNVIATPHIAACSPEAHKAVAGRIFKNILAVAEGRLTDLDRAANM